MSCHTPDSSNTEADLLDQTPAELTEIRFLALGDSYTVGLGVSNEESWPARLADALSSNLQIPVKNTIIAKTGITTAQLLNRFQTSNLESNFNLISLQIGVNDQYKGNNPEVFRADFKKLLQSVVDFNQGVTSEIVVISIPDWGVTPFGQNWDQEKIRLEIDQFNGILKTICTQNAIRFIDITEVSRASDSDWSLVTQDGLHPSAKMYERWVRKMLPEILQSIRKED